MLRVAIIGCGKIADSHASQIQRISGCEIVGVCDREELMAKQICERFAIPRYFKDSNELIDNVRPDVVHVTTPPQSHFEIARSSLERGCHVYVEKPFTLNAGEAIELIATAERMGRKITAGHDDQFRHVARRMRRLIKNGFLGGPPVHMESYYCYEMDEKSGYASALLADKQHWVRHLPGKLLHNIISHGIARLAEHLTSDDPQVIVSGFVSPTLRRLGEEEIIDELRVIINEEDRLTAYFTFSSRMRPSLHQFRIYGPRNGLMLDQDNETLIKLRGRRHKSYLEQFVPPLNFAWQYAANFLHNGSKFLANDFHPKAGMKFLIESFYRSIQEEAPLPVSYREIVLTARIMDNIFAQLEQQDGISLTEPDPTRSVRPLSESMR